MIKFLRYATIFKAYELLQPLLKYSLPLEEGLPGDVVLVIAPHPDDEAIGCGGTVRRHVRSGKGAHVVFCTMDTPVRRHEAVAAAGMAGYAATHWLDYPVGSLQGRDDLHIRLGALYAQNKPDVILVPFALDNHADHRAVNMALARMAETAGADCMVYAYPVWFPLYPNVLIDVSGVWEEKKKMIECYASQTATRDYVTMSRSLGAYWAQVKGRDLAVVETFFRMTLSGYAGLTRRLLDNAETTQGAPHA